MKCGFNFAITLKLEIIMESILINILIQHTASEKIP